MIVELQLLFKADRASGIAVLIFKLEEEGMPTLLLHLPKLVAETAVFCSAAGLDRRLVVAFLQAKKRSRRLFFMPVLSLPILCLISN